MSMGELTAADVAAVTNHGGSGWGGFGGENGTEVEIYRLDDTHDSDLIGKVTYYGTRFSLDLITPNFTAYLLKLKKK